jgi:CheY-like chemotaxis protein
MDGKPASETFLRELQKALQYIYDPAELRKSPLVEWLGFQDRANPAFLLQELLVNAIQALKPGARVPPQANAWRVYHVLTYIYVEQANQVTTAGNLGLSTRELRRQLRDAEEILANYLWIEGKLEGKIVDEANPPDISLSGAPQLEENGRMQELEWLEESFPREIVDPGSVITAISQVVYPLLQAYKTRLETELPDGLPSISGQMALLRQALVNLVTAAILSHPGEAIRLSVDVEERNLRIRVQAPPSPPPDPDRCVAIVEALKMSKQFTRLLGGTLEDQTGQCEREGFIGTLIVPVAEQSLVLVIDDNADTLRLLQRYLTGTRYKFVGARTPGEALTKVEAEAPKIIVLDVMMPGINDWELLGQLREHPGLREIPIIVCTILPQEQLALLLGAAAFLRKPVSRELFLQALDRQVED